MSALAALTLSLAFLAQPPAAEARPAVINLSNTASDSRNPALGLTSDGAQHVLWEETVDVSPTLSLTYVWHRWWNGATWSPAITVATGSRAAIAIGPDNMPHAAWTDDFGGSQAVFYSRWTGSAWDTPKLVAPGLSGDASQAAIIVDALNTVRVAWGQFDPGLPGYRLYYATAAAGGSGAWSAVPLNGANGGNTPSLALDVTGTLHLAWQAGTFGDNEIYYASLVNTNTVSLSENISQSPGIDSKWPSIVIGADNLPAVVWSESDGAQFDVAGSARRGGIWSAPVNISTSTTDSTVPRLARAGGALVAAWNEAAATPFIQRALGGGSAYGPAGTLLSGGGAWQAVALSGAPDGIVYFAYDGGSGLNGDVYADSFALLRTFLPTIRR